jgi:uncharacterized protein YndB with AHSA1/START domain
MFEGDSMPVADVIERAMSFSATRSDVWAALTTADGLSGWWADRVEVDARPGGTMLFHFGEEHGTQEAQIDVIEPEDRFAFFWRPFSGLDGVEAAPEVRTRVEFTLTDDRGRTQLLLRETGFAALPEAWATRSLAANEGGWTEELEHLASYLKTGIAVVHG